MDRLERLRLLVATGLGLGHLPVAPGTWGSLAGLLLVVGAWRIGDTWPLVAGTLLVTALGFGSADAGVSRFGQRDPGPVVVDELAGQMVSLLFLPPGVATLVVGFVLFRLVDIWKPYPVGRVEKLPGASGIMADDLLAGILANLIHHVLRWGFPGWWGGG